MLRAFGVTDKGRIRETNEDCFGIDLDLRLCVVADGMGGHNAGEVASSLAVETVLSSLRTGAIEAAWPFGYDDALSAMGNLLGSAIHAANRQIFELASNTPDYSGMGTTIVALLERDGRVSIAHAGDSRLYLLQGKTLTQMTEDDSWIAAVLSRDPEADPVALKQHPMRHALTNVVGSRSQMTVNLKEIAVAAGDRFLLTSDGVHGVVEHETLSELMRRGDDLQAIARAMIEAALAAGSRDNLTAVVGEYHAG